ncbi:MAG: prolipoprotein diacylglyceryl transferase [Archangiaceae bacterium]|nr:prolipoprotein diacylglyceryl transferase [Archangiaceae bacterium]
MMPVLYRFTFTGPLGHVFAYLIAVGIVAYTAWSGWRTAVGPLDPKTGTYKEPTREQRVERARNQALIGVGVAAFGLWYALPEVPLFGKGKGEGVPLHTYGILIGIGFLGAVSISAYLAEREWTGEQGKKMREQIFDLAFYVFVGGIGGAVLLFNIVNIKDVMASGPQMGMVFQGGLVCASGVAYWYGKKHKIDFLRLADIALPTVSLGSAFGRLGCFSAGCCWGKPRPAGSLLAVHFPGSHVQDLIGSQTGGVASAAYASMSDGRNETRWILEKTGEVFNEAVPGAVRISEWVSAHGHTLPIHPTQLYESAVQFTLFVLFISLRPFRRFHGMISGIWLMVYAIERSTVEVFRGDGERGTIHGWFDFIPRERWYNISTSQFGSLLIFSLGAWLLWSQYRKYAARPKLELPAADRVTA